MPMRSAVFTVIISFLFSFEIIAQLSAYQDSLLELAHSTSNPIEKGEIYEDLIWSLRRDYNTVSKYLDKVDQIILETGDMSLKRKNEINKGIVNRLAGNYVTALDHLHIGAELARAQGEIRFLASALYQIGAIKHQQGDYDDAFRSFTEALKNFEALDSDNDIALVKNGMANSLNRIGRQDEAIQVFSEALTIYESQDDIIGQADVLHNLANIYADRKELGLALSYYKRQEIFDKKANYTKGLAYLYKSMGDIKREQGDEQGANQEYRKSYQLWDSLGNKKFINLTQINLGLSEANLGKVKKGEKLITEAITSSQSEEDLNNVEEGYRALAEVYKTQGKYREAYHYHVKYEVLKDSLRSNEVTEQMNQLSARYESEKKLQEIQLLTTQNELNELELAQRKNVQYFLIAFTLLLLGMLLFTFQYFRQKKSLNELRHQREIDQKVTAVNRLTDRISELLDQSRQLDLRPLAEINEMLENQLSEKEHEILSCIAKGQTNKEIAKEQFISENTVKFHLKNIYSKLDVGNRRDAVRVIASLA